MTFVELENGSFINVNRIEMLKFSTMQKRHEPDWIAYFDKGAQRITDADRIRILKAAGCKESKKENDNEQ
jgi:hypothetical protein